MICETYISSENGSSVESHSIHKDRIKMSLPLTLSHSSTRMSITDQLGLNLVSRQTEVLDIHEK